MNTADSAATRCPLCGAAGDPRLTARDRNRGIGRAEFHYMGCPDCHALFLADPPADLAPYYPRAYYQPSPQTTPGGETWPDPAELPKLAILERHLASGRVAEIGPGTGAFSLSAASRGYEVSAVEMDVGACERLRRRGIEVLHSDRPDLCLPRLAPVQAVCMWQVIEHLRHPRQTLRAAAGALAPGGVLIVATPNPASLQMRLLGKRWPHLDAPRHLTLVPASRLRELCEEYGLEVVEFTAADRTAADWNSFGWAQMLTTPHSGRRRIRLAFRAGALAALMLAPIERHGLNGSSYTTVLRKPR